MLFTEESGHFNYIDLCSNHCHNVTADSCLMTFPFKNPYFLQKCLDLSICKLFTITSTHVLNVEQQRVDFPFACHYLI